MFQTKFQGMAVNQQQLEQNQSFGHTLTLPSIQKKIITRGSSNPSQQNIAKQTLQLPNIKGSSEVLLPSANPPQNHNIKNGENKSEFAMEVEEKLKLVLGGMKVEFPNEIAESIDSEQFDFQEEINKNKEMLKVQRMKKEDEKIQVKKIPPKSKHSKNRNESLYEKRAREYTEFIGENKILLKKKVALVKEKEKGQKTDHHFKSIETKDLKGRKIGIRKQTPKKSHPRVLSQKKSFKNLTEVSKSVNLFDNIQNYLENPQQAIKNREKESQKNETVGLSLMYAKRNLEQKIKAYDRKLGIKDEENKGKIGESLGELGEWRKIQIGEKNIKCESSTFEKEIQRISSLQQKNTEFLQKYLDQQKLLLMLEYQKRYKQNKLESKSH